jgi:7-cyano-7-deazaguanine synthase
MLRCVVALSGGMDSATLIPYAKMEYESVTAIGFDYGSKHNRYEMEAAANIADHYGIPYQLIPLPFVGELFSSTLLKSGGPVPEGHYEDPIMASTIVPGRNLIMISIMAGFVDSIGGGDILLGVHAGDRAVYPDCREEFLVAVDTVFTFGSTNHVGIGAPFLNNTKARIVGIGNEFGVPFHLTRTCYKDQPVACGKCGSCQERLEAFRSLGLTDPIPYEAA